MDYDCLQKIRKANREKTQVKDIVALSSKTIIQEIIYFQ